VTLLVLAIDQDLAEDMYEACKVFRQMRARRGYPRQPGEQFLQFEELLNQAARGVSNQQESSIGNTVQTSAQDDLNDRAFLSRADAAMLTGFSEATIDRRIRNGDLRALRPAGRSVRIARVDLDEFMARQKPSKDAA
jgi:excisionase family DNA binding protein